MLKARVIALSLIVTLSCVPLLAQTAADKDLLERIRKEEANNSQIMKTEHMLTDVYGPRLTGSIVPRQKKFYLLIDAEAAKAAGVSGWRYTGGRRRTLC
jgi:hypothetical protein